MGGNSQNLCLRACKYIYIRLGFEQTTNWILSYHDANLFSSIKKSFYLILIFLVIAFFQLSAYLKIFIVLYKTKNKFTFR